MLAPPPQASTAAVAVLAPPASAAVLAPPPQASTAAVEVAAPQEAEAAPALEQAVEAPQESNQAPPALQQAGAAPQESTQVVAVNAVATPLRSVSGSATGVHSGGPTEDILQFKFCLEELGSDLVEGLMCGHVFHTACIHTWTDFIRIP